MNIDIAETEERSTELIALARLVAFAIESAKALDAEVRVNTPTGEKTWYVVEIDYP